MGQGGLVLVKTYEEYHTIGLCYMILLNGFLWVNLEFYLLLYMHGRDVTLNTKGTYQYASVGRHGESVAN